MKRATNALQMRAVALAAAMLVLFVSSDWAQRGRGGGGGAQRSAPVPRFSQPRIENRNVSPQVRQTPRQQNEPRFKQNPQSQGRSNGNFQERPQQENFAPTSRPGVNGSRPNSNGARQPYGGPHLQDWLNRNQNVPLQEQEKQLRNDPSFKRLPKADQQRLTQRLRQMDSMPEQQRDRRLARNEMLERLSPEQRMSINRSGREWSALPADRQMQMRRAFQDLRGVPIDQRQTVLNSSRYQNMFTPEERGILSDFLKVEPYQPQQR